MVRLCLVHLLDQAVDVLFSVTSSTTLNVVEELSSDTPSTVWVGESEWIQEVVGLLEVWANGVDLVDQILNGDDTVLT